jgi:hypothetical protein
MDSMPNFLEYQKSVAQEFKAYENRVRNLIDSTNWGEEGRFKEIILRNYLKRVLPNNIGVGTGFIRNNEVITSQIDIIIYNQSYPLLFSEGDFIVATPENIIGIIEVKTRIDPSTINSIIKKANENANIICGNTDKALFNGIFSFNCGRNIHRYIDNLKQVNYKYLLEKQHFNQIISNKLYSCVNHIALGNEYFIKLWPTGNSGENNEVEYLGEPPHFSVYDMQEGLAFSYFLSNLLEQIIRNLTGYINNELPNEMKSFLYPLPKGKESRLIDQIQLEIIE